MLYDVLQCAYDVLYDVLLCAPLCCDACRDVRCVLQSDVVRCSMLYMWSDM